MASRLLTLLGGRNDLTWLLYDKFIVPDTAPITSPRTCEPGPGELTVVDTGNNADVVGGELVYTGVAGNGDPRVSGDLSATITSRANGVGYASFAEYSIKGAADKVYHGLNSADTTIPTDQVFLQTGTALSIIDKNNTIALGTVFTLEQLSKCVGITRPAGAFFIVDGSLRWVGVEGNGIEDTILFNARTSAAETKCTTLDARSLPANGYTAFETEFGPATNAIASPSSGETTTSEADSWNEFTWTVAAAETLEWLIRRTDDTHAWIVRGDQAGSTIKIIEINGGETERASAAQTWTDTTAYRVIVIADNEDIYTFVDTTAKNSYGSAAYNKTVTGVKISGFAAGADLVCWPRNMVPLLPSDLV